MLPLRLQCYTFFISGPATIQMVSTNSSPPVPLPMHVPQGCLGGLACHLLDPDVPGAHVRHEVVAFPLQLKIIANKAIEGLEEGDLLGAERGRLHVVVPDLGADLALVHKQLDGLLHLRPVQG